MKNRPLIGTGVYIVKDNKILLGKRIGSHGTGTRSAPGGHLEFNESYKECAIREVMEETGLEIKNISFITITEDFFENNNKHYVTLHLKAQYEGGEPKILEPHKWSEWEWFDNDKLPEPLFLPIENLIRQNFNLFD